MSRRTSFHYAAFTLLVACSGNDFGTTEENLGESPPRVRVAPAQSVVMTAFTGSHSVYGYAVTVKKDARIGGSIQHETGLSGTVGIFGPYEDPQFWGESLAEKDDQNAPLSIEAVVPADGTYLVAFKLRERPAANTPFLVKLRCDGSPEQCGVEQEPPSTLECISDEGPVLIDHLGGHNHELDHCRYLIGSNLSTAGHLLIGPGSTLVAANGAGIATPNEAQITAGDVDVLGTETAPVRFSHVRLVAGKVKVAHFETDAKVDARSLEAADSIFRTGGVSVGRNDGSSAGPVVLKRSLIEGAQFGLTVSGAETVLIEDCVIAKNEYGIRVGQGAGYGSCAAPSAAVPRLYDPTIRHTDIIDNNQVGIFVTDNRTLLQVEHSNLIRNRQAILLLLHDIGPGSFIRQNNFVTNATVPYVQSYHRSGMLAVQKNYWGTGTGAMLSNRWQFCSGIEVDTWGGIATKEAPDAGPRREKLIEQVEEKCWKSE